MSSTTLPLKQQTPPTVADAVLNGTTLPAGGGSSVSLDPTASAGQGPSGAGDIGGSTPASLPTDTKTAPAKIIPDKGADPGAGTPYVPNGPNTDPTTPATPGDLTNLNDLQPGGPSGGGTGTTVTPHQPLVGDPGNYGTTTTPPPPATTTPTTPTTTPTTPTTTTTTKPSSTAFTNYIDQLLASNGIGGHILSDIGLPRAQILGDLGGTQKSDALDLINRYDLAGLIGAPDTQTAQQDLNRQDLTAQGKISDLIGTVLGQLSNPIQAALASERGLAANGQDDATLNNFGTDPQAYVDMMIRQILANNGVSTPQDLEAQFAGQANGQQFYDPQLAMKRIFAVNSPTALNNQSGAAIAMRRRGDDVAAPF